jgi:hypothetical protein
VVGIDLAGHSLVEGPGLAGDKAEALGPVVVAEEAQAMVYRLDWIEVDDRRPVVHQVEERTLADL